MSSRDQILSNVQAALARSGDKPELPDALVTSDLAGAPDCRRLFQERLHAVGGIVHRVQDLAEAAESFGRIIKDLKLTRIARSDSPWLRPLCDGTAQVEWLEASPFPSTLAQRTPLFAAQAGLCAAQLAIAETGTLALDSSVELHRLASLVPPVHIALLFGADIVPTMSEALAQFEERGLPPTLTFITGPSRTADIELELVVGVHGPRVLHVLLVEESEDR